MGCSPIRMGLLCIALSSLTSASMCGIASCQPPRSINKSELNKLVIDKISSDYLSHLGCLSITSETIEKDIPTGKKTEHSVGVFKQNDSFYSYEHRLFMEPVGYPGLSSADKPFAMGSNSRYEFSLLSRTSGSAEWKVSEFRKRRGQVESKKPTIGVFDNSAQLPLSLNHFAVAHHTLTQILKHQKFEVKSSEISRIDGMNYATVRFSHPDIAPLWDDKLPQLTFDLDRGCLKEYRIGERAGSIKVEVICVFDYAAAVFPRLNKISKRTKFTNGEKGKDIIERDKITSITYFPQGRFPESAFTLSAFGLPEPVTETPPPNRNFLWITLGSVAAVIIAILVRRKIKSLEAKAS